MWLQNRREATIERTRPSTTVRRDEPGEFRVGRLKHERVKVPRGENMMEWAESVMHIHADRKSVLEVLKFNKLLINLTTGANSWHIKDR